MIKTKKLFVLVFLLLNCILFSACSQSKEVDFVKKYKIDLNTISDVTEVLQKAIDELPDDGVLFLQDGTYPLAGRIVFKENMTFKLSDNAILLNCSQDKNPMMAYNHPYKHNKAEGNSNIIIEGGIWDMNGQLDESGTPKKSSQCGVHQRSWHRLRKQYHDPQYYFPGLLQRTRDSGCWLGQCSD